MDSHSNNPYNNNSSENVLFIRCEEGKRDHQERREKYETAVTPHDKSRQTERERFGIWWKGISGKQSDA